MGTFLGDPHNKDYSILRSILGSPYFGKLPNPESQSKPARLLRTMSGSPCGSWLAISCRDHPSEFMQLPG